MPRCHDVGSVMALMKVSRQLPTVIIRPRDACNRIHYPRFYPRFPPSFVTRLTWMVRLVQISPRFRAPEACQSLISRRQCPTSQAANWMVTAKVWGNAGRQEAFPNSETLLACFPYTCSRCICLDPAGKNPSSNQAISRLHSLYQEIVGAQVFLRLRSSSS